MDYSAIAKISGSGLAFQKARVEAATQNLANIGTVADASGRLYRPITAVARSAASVFAGSLSMLREASLGVSDIQYVENEAAEIKTYEPGHVLADANGFVSHPNVDHLNEMMTIASAMRIYEANLSAIQAARVMASKALEIGAGS